VYARIREWMEKEGFELANSPYEIYRTDPYQSIAPVDYVTEVYFPVKKKT
jgi:effector-binding domain-containing protein